MSRYRLPAWVLVYAVACALLVFVWSSCISGNKAATLGGASGGAAIGAAVGGPLGAGIGGLAGAAGGDMLVDDPPTTVHNTNVDAQPGSTVHVAALKAEPRAWYWDARLWVAAYLVFRFRSGIIAFFRSLFTGGFLAAGATLLGLVFGGKASDAAKDLVERHAASRRTRRRGPPAVIVDSEVNPHA